MPSRPETSRHRRAFLLVVATATLAVLGLLVREVQRYAVTDRLLLAPMIGGLDICMIEPADPASERDAHMKQDCRRPGGSAAARVKATLDEIGPRFSPNGRYELGYTLNIPLLQLFRKHDGDWRIDQELVSRFVRTIKDADWPVIVYFFATHFSVKAPIEAELASDPGNLAVSHLGPMAIDKYHGLDVFPWSIATTDNGITRRRVEAINALVAAVCDLPWWHRRKIRAVTLLGEVHHLFPGFEAGMGFAPPYIVSDYGASSASGFRAYLSARFGNVETLNKHLGSAFPEFNAVDLPAKDIRREPLRHFWEHIDSYAHGALAINGWAHRLGQPTPVWVRIYLNGRLVGRVPADLGRQDVAEAHPQIGTADLGWRFDLPFADLPHGLHRIDVVAEVDGNALQTIGSRRFAHVDRGQGPVREMPFEPLSGVQPADTDLMASIDSPVDLTPVFFNPLVPIWHDFRQRQVVNYLSFFAQRLQGTCLAKRDTYVHQIAPHANPSWDATKYAVDASLRPIEGLRLGISLYGESTYGRSFFDWYTRESGQKSYGVTEFHPLRAMDADEMRGTLDRHRAHGARFVTFFVDGQPRRALPGGQSIFVYTTFNPDVTAFGSDRLFKAVQANMNR